MKSLMDRRFAHFMHRMQECIKNWPCAKALSSFLYLKYLSQQIAIHHNGNAPKISSMITSSAGLRSTLEVWTL